MSTVQATPTILPSPFVAKDKFGPFRMKRLIVVVIYIALAVAPGALGPLTRGLMVDAYVQVASFVAATLLLFYGAERVFKFDIGDALQNAKGYQVPLAALLGSTPGCGGAVVVVAAYSSGNVGFGAVVAALTATMGDAAFLLIATRPDAAMVVLPLSFAAGIMTGWIIDALKIGGHVDQNAGQCELAPLIGRTRIKDYAYLAIGVPGLVIGISQLAQMDLEAVYGDFMIWVGLAGILIGLLIWSTSDLQAMTNAKDSPVTRMAEETSFIVVWVIGAYLVFDYTVAYAGLDLKAMFNSVGVLLPMVGIIIGFIPGCGPQVLVSTFYINGLIPFSALMGNAISNDGDALFPAIALNPRVAMMATVYSALPAILLAYLFHFFAPGFMN